MIRSCTSGLAAFAAALVTVSLNAGPASSPYQRVALPSLGGSAAGAVALGINDRRQIVGYSVFAEGVDEEGGPDDIVHAVLWDKGTITDLGTLAGGESLATAINNAGQIVGYSDRHAVMWDRGSIFDLGTLAPDATDGTSFSYAKAINNRGQIVGEGSAAGNSQCTRALLWDRGTIVDLGTLVGGACEWPEYHTSTAIAINDRGQIAGTSDGLDGLPHAVIWDRGRIVDLGPFLAAGMNNRGEVVGSNLVIWRLGRMTTLEMPSGNGRSYATAINDRGQVVGYHNVYEDGVLQSSHPLLWEGGKPNTALGTIGYPWAINTRGDIVGSYRALPVGRPTAATGACLWTR